MKNTKNKLFHVTDLSLLKKWKPPCDWYNLCLQKNWNKQATRCAGTVQDKKLAKPQKLVVKSHKYTKEKSRCTERSAYNTQVPGAGRPSGSCCWHVSNPSLLSAANASWPTRTCRLSAPLSPPLRLDPLTALWCQARLRWQTEAGSAGSDTGKASPTPGDTATTPTQALTGAGVPVPSCRVPRQPLGPGPAAAAARGRAAGRGRERPRGRLGCPGRGEPRPRTPGRLPGVAGCGGRPGSPGRGAPIRRHRSAGSLPLPRARTIPFFCRTKVEPFTRLETTATLKPSDTAAGPGLCAAPSPAAAPTAIRMAPARAAGAAAARAQRCRQRLCAGTRPALRCAGGGSGRQRRHRGSWRPARAGPAAVTS